MVRYLELATLGLVGLFVVIQLVPYRVDHPPTTQAMVWEDPAIQSMVERACYDCHSNTTKVPWYGHVAPVAWYVNNHVQEARGKLNFSEMDVKPQKEAHEAGEEVREGKMPPDYYLDLHPEAVLTDAERLALADVLDQTLAPWFRADRKH